MTDEDDNLPQRSRSRSLARAAPPLSSPALPASSGAFWGSRTAVLKHDTDFVDQHALFLKARVAQTSALTELVQGRLELATVLSRLGRLDEIIAHDARMFSLHAQTKEALAEAELAQARSRLSQYSSSASTATASDHLVNMVDDLVSQMPDVPEEARNTLRELLTGALQEKKR